MADDVQGRGAIEWLRRLTRAAAVAAAPWIGKGDGVAADQAAVDALHKGLSNGQLSCIVVIGEGVKDEAPMLVHGELYGPDVEDSKRYDFAVDPVEGTTSVAKGEPGGMAVAALGERGSFQEWLGIHYMHKLVVGPKAARLMDNGEVSLNLDPELNMRRVAEALGKRPQDMKIAVLDRDRNMEIIEAARRIGAEPVLLPRGDVTPAMQTCNGGAIDMLYNSGGAPEAVLTATYVAIMGGNMQAMWDPKTKEEDEIVLKAGHIGKILTLEDLVGDGELHFSATGITPSALLEGCTQAADGTWQAGSTIAVSRPSAP